MERFFLYPEKFQDLNASDIFVEPIKILIFHRNDTKYGDII